MNTADKLLFFFTGLCCHLENKGIINNAEFTKHLFNMLDNPHIKTLSEQDKAELEEHITALMPLHIVE